VLCELVHESIKEPTTKGFTLLKIITSPCVCAAGRERKFGVDTHPKYILGRGVPKLLQNLHICK